MREAGPPDPLDEIQAAIGPCVVYRADGLVVIEEHGKVIEVLVSRSDDQTSAPHPVPSGRPHLFALFRRVIRAARHLRTTPAQHADQDLRR